MMKIFLRNVILLLMTCVSLNTTAYVWANQLLQYKIPQSSNIQDYKNLVGNTLIYVPKKYVHDNPLGEHMCKVNVIAVEGKTPDKMVITFQKDGEDQPIIMKYNFNGKFREGYLRYSQFNFLDYQKWSNKDQDEYPSFTDPMVKGEFKVHHYSLVLGDFTLDEYATISNSTTGVKREVKWTGPESANQIFDYLKKRHWSSTYGITLPDGEKQDLKLSDISDSKYLLQRNYECDLFNLIIVTTDTGLGIDLTNKSNQPIIINWDMVAYVDQNRNASKTMHNGIRYIDRMAPQAPTLIPGHSVYSDVIVPVCNIYQEGSEWKTKDLVAAPPSVVDDSMSMDFVLPLEINGKTEYYTITINHTKEYTFKEYLNLD